MRNPVIEGLHSRKSVRAYEDRPIPPDLKEEILLAAAAAPTAGNQQLYTILDITDREIQEHLAVSCDDQPFIARGQMLLVFCADFQKWYDAFVCAGCSPRHPGAGDLMLAVQDAALAAQNAVTAAWSLGIGSCYIGDIMERCEEHRELLGLPEYVFPALCVVFGYPTPQQLERQKPQRCALGHIVHENRYRRMEESELREMLRKNAGAQPDYETWCRRFCERKYNADFSIEMTRSVEEYLRAFRAGEA